MNMLPIGFVENSCYWFRRKFMFQQRRLRFSGWQTDKNYRLFRKSKVRFSAKRIVHETLEVNGTSSTLSRMKAKEAIQKGKSFSIGMLFGKPAFTFVYNYIFRLGIFDGMKGIKVCYLNALGDWERYLELRKLEQEQKVPSLKPVSQRGN